MTLVAANTYKKLEALHTTASGVEALPLEQVRALAQLLLAEPNPDELMQAGRSGLNSDGTPLQYCISSRNGGWAGRLIADPASFLPDPEARYQRSMQALEALFGASQSEVLRPWIMDMIRFHLPADGSARDYPDGVLWLGAALKGPGMAVYMDGRRGGNGPAWRRLGDWLYSLNPNMQGLETWLSQMSAHADIMSIGIEGSSLKNARAKVYWRLRQPLLLDELGLEIYREPGYKDFLREMAGSQPMRLFGMVFCAGIHIASGQVFDGKIDLCGCPDCLGTSSAGWVARLQHFTHKLDLPSFPIDQTSLQSGTQVSYFGYGRDIRGQERLNLYLKSSGKH